MTSLALLQQRVGLADALDAVLERLGPRLLQVRRDHRILTDDYLDASDLKDKIVVIHSGKDVWRGTVRSLSLNDGLELQVGPRESRYLPVEFIRSVVPIDVE